MSDLEDRRWSEQEEPAEMLETDHAIGIVDGKNALIKPEVLRARLNKGPQVFDDHVKGESFEGSGALLTDLTSPGPGGSSSEADLELVCNSAGDNPTTKILGRKNVTGIFEIDENGFLLKTGPYSHSDDAIPFDKDINQNGKELINSKTILDQQIDPYYKFDGVDDEITIPDNKNLNFGINDYSIVFSFKTSADFSGGIGYIFSKQTGSNDGYSCYIDISNKLVFIFDTTITSFILSDGVINDGNWHTACYLADRDGNMSMFLDGLLQSDTSTIDADNTTNAIDFIIGSKDSGNFFNGDINGVTLRNYLPPGDEAKSISSNPQKALDFADEGGSNVPQNVSTCVNSGVDPYDTFSGASATGYTVTKSTSVGIAVVTSGLELTLVKGKFYLIFLNLTLNSGSVPKLGFRKSLLGGAISGERNTVNGKNAIVLECTETSSGLLHIRNLDGALTDYTIADLDIHQLGATLSLDGKNFTANTAYDSSGNGNHGTVTGATLANKQTSLQLEEDLLAGNDITAKHRNLTISEGKTLGHFTESNSESLLNGEYVDLDLDLAASFSGILNIISTINVSALTRRGSVYFITGRLTDNFTSTLLASGSGSSGGTTFTVTNPSNNIVRVTNTHALEVTITVSFSGLGGF